MLGGSTSSELRMWRPKKRQSEDDRDAIYNKSKVEDEDEDEKRLSEDEDEKRLSEDEDEKRQGKQEDGDDKCKKRYGKDESCIQVKMKMVYGRRGRA